MTPAELDEAVAQIAGPDAGAAERALVREALLAAEHPGPMPAGMAGAAAATLARISRGTRTWLDLAWPVALGGVAWWQGPHLVALAAAIEGAVGGVMASSPAPLGAVALAAAVLLALRAVEAAER